MRRNVEIEIREQAGKEPMLHGVLLTEGRAASGGRAEVFAPGSLTWPTDGVGIAPGHRAATESYAHPVRSRDGEIRVSARATPRLRAAVAEGRRWMSVEFHALEERETRGGVREILRALAVRAVLTASPEYDTTQAEVRERKVRRIWL